MPPSKSFEQLVLDCLKTQKEELDKIEGKVDKITDVVTDLRLQVNTLNTKASFAGFFAGLIPVVLAGIYKLIEYAWKERR